MLASISNIVSERVYHTITRAGTSEACLYPGYPKTSMKAARAIISTTAKEIHQLDSYFKSIPVDGLPVIRLKKKKLL